MMLMFEHRDILLAHTTKKTWHIGSVRWSCHEEPAKLSCRVHFFHAESFLGQKFPAHFAGVCLISAGFQRLNSLWTLGWPLSQPVQHLIQFCHHKDVNCTSSSSSSTSALVQASVSDTPPTSFGHSGPPTGLSSPLSSNFLFGDIKRGMRTGSSNI